MTTRTKMTSEIHKIQGLIDKYSQIMDEYDYIQICNSLKKINDVKDTVMNSPLPDPVILLDLDKHMTLADIVGIIRSYINETPDDFVMVLYFGGTGVRMT